MDEFSTVLGYEHILPYEVNKPKAVKFIKEITTHFTLQYPIKNYVPEDADDNYIIAL
jgi:hypothetical protein